MRGPITLLLAGWLLIGATGGLMAAAPTANSTPEARVYIISPADGESVTGPVTVRFGLAGMGVAPAGIERPGTGHHHLLIDVTERPPLDNPLPNDSRHMHFGGGQTEVTLDLEPGEHTLQLIFADHNHVPHDPPLISDQIKIEVQVP